VGEREKEREGGSIRIGGKEEVTQKIGREGQRGSGRLEMLKGRESEQIVQ
jgi:hypothetical protein